MPLSHPAPAVPAAPDPAPAGPCCPAQTFSAPLSARLFGPLAVVAGGGRASFFSGLAEIYQSFISLNIFMIFMVFRFSGREIGWNGLFLPGRRVGRGCSDGDGRIFFESVGAENGQGGGMAGYRLGRAGKSLRDKGLLARIVNKGEKKNLGVVPVLKSWRRER